MSNVSTENLAVIFLEVAKYGMIKGAKVDNIWMLRCSFTHVATVISKLAH